MSWRRETVIERDGVRQWLDSIETPDDDLEMQIRAAKDAARRILIIIPYSPFVHIQMIGHVNPVTQIKDDSPNFVTVSVVQVFTSPQLDSVD